MSTMLSRWPVVMSVALERSDTDDQNVLTEPGVERIFAVARTAYFELCTSVEAEAIESVTTSSVIGVLTDGATVTISVGVVEIYPDSFVMEARIRPMEGEGIAARARASLAVDVTDTMKDEFIAIAHAARAMH